MHDTSTVTTGGQSRWGRARVGALILWSVLTIFDCAIVLHRELNAYLDWEEKRHWLLLCLSEVMFCGGETHYWQWHKQLFLSWVKGRKLLNKEEITGKEGHRVVRKSEFSLIGLKSFICLFNECLIICKHLKFTCSGQYISVQSGSA